MFDTQGNLHVGPTTSNLPGRIKVAFDAANTDGIALNVVPTPVAVSNKAAIKLGDFTFGQDVAGTGEATLGVLNSAGAVVATLAGTQPRGELFRSTIPLVICPTGTMGDNGALTSGTANPQTYVKTWTWLPTGAIYTASPAGFYWTVWTNTTTATVYQEKWTAGNPTAPSSATAWAKTGPGAFTGPTTNAVYVPISLAALGVNDIIRGKVKTQQTNNANAKTLTARMTDAAGTAFCTAVATSLAATNWEFEIAGAGYASAQICTGFAIGSTAIARGSMVLSTEATGVAFVLALCVEKGTATDSLVIDSILVTRE